MDTIVIYNYFLARRVIAYALLGDEAQTRASLESLREVPNLDDFGQAILAANSTDAKILCQTAYDYYVQNPWGNAQFDPNLSLFFTPGDIYEDVGAYVT